MLAEALAYQLPKELYATEPPEARGLIRDEVRLLVQYRGAASVAPRHARFTDLAEFLRPGDLLVANDSATVAASLPAQDPAPLRVHLGNRLEDGSWLIEPRTEEGGPVSGDSHPLRPGCRISLGTPEDQAELTLQERYRGFFRLWRAHIVGDLEGVIARSGQPISYPYVGDHWPLDTYQTVFARTPGSAEMPSAGRPFTLRLLHRLQSQGVEVATITLHTGLSSHEVETDIVEEAPMYPEWFRVTEETADAVNATRRRGDRVIAVGTTVVRALESAIIGAEDVDESENKGREHDKVVKPTEGYTELFVTRERGVHTVDGLITGLHAPRSTHLAMLSAFVEPTSLRAVYEEAIEQGYLWHEFGDMHLLGRAKRDPQ